MKLTIALMTVGLVCLGSIPTVYAGSFSTCDEDHQDLNRTPQAWNSSTDSNDVKLVPDRSDSDGLIEIDGNRIAASSIRQKSRSGRVDLLIKRSHNGIQITLSPQQGNDFVPHQLRRAPSVVGDVEFPSRVCCVARDSDERTSLQLRDRSVTGEMSRTKRDHLFDVKFTHVPGPTSLVLSILDLIGVVMGCYCPRRSNVL